MSDTRRALESMAVLLGLLVAQSTAMAQEQHEVRLRAIHVSDELPPGADPDTWGGGDGFASLCMSESGRICGVVGTEVDFGGLFESLVVDDGQGGFEVVRSLSASPAMVSGVSLSPARMGLFGALGMVREDMLVVCVAPGQTSEDSFDWPRELWRLSPEGELAPVLRVGDEVPGAFGGPFMSLSFVQIGPDARLGLNATIGDLPSRYAPQCVLIGDLDGFTSVLRWGAPDPVRPGRVTPDSYPVALAPNGDAILRGGWGEGPYEAQEIFEVQWRYGADGLSPGPERRVIGVSPDGSFVEAPPESALRLPPGVPAPTSVSARSRGGIIEARAWAGHRIDDQTNDGVNSLWIGPVGGPLRRVVPSFGTLIDGSEMLGLNGSAILNADGYAIIPAFSPGGLNNDLFIITPAYGTMRLVREETTLEAGGRTLSVAHPRVLGFATNGRVLLQGTAQVGVRQWLDVTFIAEAPGFDCFRDWNADGVVNEQDWFDFTNDFFGGTGPRKIGDFDRDGVQTDTDFFGFVNAYVAGC